MESLNTRTLRAFERAYVPEPNTGCWLWTSATDAQGYGIFGRGRVLPQRAARASWVLHRGPIAPGEVVFHRCGERSCVNPDHLRALPAAQSHVEARAQGRVARGESHGKVRLSESAVRSIRAEHAAGEKPTSLGRRHGVAESTVRDIVERRSWRHLP